MTTSPARLAANRTNSARSTGPRTLAGKTASSRNSTRHGLLARQPLLADEDPAEFEALAGRVLEQFAPEGGAEELLVDDIVGLLWRLQRLVRVEVAIFSIGQPQFIQKALSAAGETASGVGYAFAERASAFAVLSRYETALVNRLRRSLADLERLQQAREASTPAFVLIAGEG